MKISKNNNARWAIGMFAAMISAMMVMSATSVVMAQTATVPTLSVGDSAYFGGIVDADDYKDEMNDALKQYEDLGFDVTYKVNGGAGAYMGWEVASNDADVNGYTCYDLEIMGAVAIDMRLDATVKGSIDAGEYGGTITVDAKGTASVWFEAKFVDSHMYLTVDELAIAKIVLKVTAEGEFSGNIDATVSAMGEKMEMDVDASGSINDVEISVTMEFNPPIDMYQFPITQNDEWYVPAVDTEMTVTKTAKGTVKYDVDGVAKIPGEDDDTIDKHETINIADLIGDYLESTTIPGGAPLYGWYGGGIMFECTEVSGDIFIIEMPGLMNGMDMYGTRQDFTDPSSMFPEMPAMGLAFDESKGMFTGVAMDGEIMTEPVDKADVESFVEAPREAVVDETGGGASSGSSMLLPMLLIVVVIVVVVVVVVMMSKKKKAPVQQGPQEYAPQPGYQQPPPQYTPEGQYQQPPPQDQYQQYPPPPPQQ